MKSPTTSALLSVAALLSAPLASARVKPGREAKFAELARKGHGLIKLDSQLYDELTEAPRNYSVSVLLTALGDQYKCQPCKLFDPEHALVAKQWSKHSERDQHFIAVLDFADGQAVFQRLKLTSAPLFYLFKPTEGPRASGKGDPESFDFSRGGFQAEGVAEYLKNSAQIPLNFARPVDKLKVASLIGAMAVVAISLLTAWPALKVILRQTWLWAAATSVVILLMTSGYMWNKIRHPLYVQVGQGGQVNYIQGGYSNQLGVETHIIAAIYGILAFSAYTLAHTIPKLQDPVRQRLGIYVWTGISVVMLGVLMNIFGIKQGGYPFRLF